MRTGTLCISLDTEYFWGVHDTAPIEYSENVRVAREKTIPLMLELFKKYGIHVTWAVVGGAFAETKDELMKYLPEKAPTYDNPKRSPYGLVRLMEADGERPSALLAGRDIQTIQKVPYQEIGTHTFTHYYCNEKGQTPEQFKADMEAAVAMAEDHGIRLTSLVFPKGEYSEPYLRICASLGVKVYRGVEENWIYNSKLPLIIKRILRFADAYFPLSGHNCHPLREDYGVLNICGSRIFKPYSKLLCFIEPLKIVRIKSQMKYAAKNGEIFHLWWHPHNFGSNVEKNLANLEKVLKYYKAMQGKYQMKSLNMGEIYSDYKK